MIEVIDNALQLMVTACCAGIAGVWAVRRKSQSYLIAACFYGVYSLGQVYWLIYLMLTSYTPKIFYVSDLSWMASFVFLLTLEVYLATPEEKAFRCPAAFLSPVLGAGLMLFYMQWGDYVTNLLLCGLTSAVGWFSLRGFLWARRQSGKARGRQQIHLCVLFILLMVYGLWTASCFWTGDPFSNPYLMFDVALTVGLTALLPCMRKAAEA